MSLMESNDRFVRKAFEGGFVVPAFNMPHLQMMEPVVKAVRDENAFAFVAVARLEWIKFQSKSLSAVYEEYARHADPAHVSIHLDHVPVVDEDNLTVDYMPIFKEAIAIGYKSVMIDGSRLPLHENIEHTKRAADYTHGQGVAIEAELGAVMGHEDGPIPPYDELFETGKGFTDPAEAAEFVEKTGCDWLSVAIGNIHGAVSAASRDKKKVAARLNISHLEALRKAARIPLVLHGGSGIQIAYVRQAIKAGIAKINVGTEIRQAFESNGVDAVYARTREILRDFELTGSASKVV